ncbi:MAG: hypothetical protein ABI397_02685 [Candidatus Saccharimonas sp.]
MEPPKNYDTLYPKVKSYDEVRLEQEKLQAIRRARLPKHPKSLALFIIFLELSSLGWLAFVMPSTIEDKSVVVLAAVILSIVWMISSYFGIRKIIALFDQITHK